MPRALVTGSAGFIGFHLSRRLLTDGWSVVGLDAMTDYYDVSLKVARHDLLKSMDGFSAIQADMAEDGVMEPLLAGESFDAVFHLAAQAGVRYSLDEPSVYVASNLVGTFNLLEAVRRHPVPHLLMASTSSVYGANEKMPYAETDRAVSQMSFYAATKAANEAMAHSYAHLFDQPTTMFRFFTVYGPWGRPDMAYFKFTRAILDGEPIDVYNHGDMRRDFTYVGDLIEALVRLVAAVPEHPTVAGPVSQADSLSPVAPFRVVNIGNGSPVELMDFIAAIEKALGCKAKIRMGDMQPGDVPATWSDTSLLQQLTGFAPSADLEDGMREFVEWYRDFYDRSEA